MRIRLFLFNYNTTIEGFVDVANNIVRWFNMTLGINQKNNISFQARVGKNLINQARKEFKYNQVKVDKFEKMVEDTFKNNVDENFVIDIDKNKNLLFSHLAMPSVKYMLKRAYNPNNLITLSVINECSKNVAYGQFMLFKNIISKLDKAGKDMNEISKFSENLMSENSKTSFSNLITVAKMIKEENPKSKLTNDEFELMSMKKAEEEMKIEGTELNNLINNLEIKFSSKSVKEEAGCSFVSFYNIE